jgi:hypothetical protein
MERRVRINVDAYMASRIDANMYGSTRTDSVEKFSLTIWVKTARMGVA